MSTAPTARTAPCCWQPDRGTARPPSCWTEATAARARLDYACAVLDERGVVVCPAFGDAVAPTRAALRRVVRRRWPDGDGSFVFWTRPDDAVSFDADGHLRRPLVLHVDAAPTARATTAALRAAGLTVTAGPQPHTLRVSDPSGPQP